MEDKVEDKYENKKSETHLEVSPRISCKRGEKDIANQKATHTWV